MLCKIFLSRSLYIWWNEFGRKKTLTITFNPPELLVILNVLIHAIYARTEAKIYKYSVIPILLASKGKENWFEKSRVKLQHLTEERETTFGSNYREVWKNEGSRNWDPAGLLTHQILSFARDWSKRVMWLNMPQLKLGNIWVTFSNSKTARVAILAW